MLKTLSFALLLPPLLGACSYYRVPSVGDLPFVHKVDIQQGNVITQEMVGQLRRGMDKKKVQYIMGTPVIKDTFHAERWDYIYTWQERGGAVEKRRITLVFADDKLDRVVGNVKPAEGEIEVELHQDTTVDVPKGRKRGIVARVAQAIPFTGDEEEQEKAADGKAQGEDKDGKTADAQDDARASDDKDTEKDKDATTSRGEGALASTAKTSVEVPEDPDAEMAKPAPVANTYANIQAAPGEGIIVPPEAPRGFAKKGLFGRFIGVFGLGEPDYVRPSPDENKPPERLVKRPEDQE